MKLRRGQRGRREREREREREGCLASFDDMVPTGNECPAPAASGSSREPTAAAAAVSLVTAVARSPS